MSIIQFIIDLIWNLSETITNKMETDQLDNNLNESQSIDLIIEAITNLIKVIQFEHFSNQFKNYNVIIMKRLSMI